MVRPLVDSPGSRSAISRRRLRLISWASMRMTTTRTRMMGVTMDSMVLFRENTATTRITRMYM